MTTIMGERVLEQLALVSTFTGSSLGADMTIPRAMTMLVSIIMVLTFMGSLYFFVYQRKQVAREGLGRQY